MFILTPTQNDMKLVYTPNLLFYLNKGENNTSINKNHLSRPPLPPVYDVLNNVRLTCCHLTYNIIENN